MEYLFFDSWSSLFRTFLITVLAYVLLIFFLRVSGKRTLSQMNAFDFIVTIALGSTLATVSLNKQVPLADGALAFFLLISMQYLITWLAVRSKRVKNIVTKQPTLLVYRGEVFSETLKKHRISMDELNLAIRKHGKGNLDNIDAVVLETTGSMTVIPEIDANKTDVFENVENFPKN